MLISRPWVLTEATARSMEFLRSFSSGLWSKTLLPSSTEPTRAVAFALARSASASVVLPDELWPTRTMFRMSFVSYLGILDPPAGREVGEDPSLARARQHPNRPDCTAARGRVSTERLGPTSGSPATPRGTRAGRPGRSGIPRPARPATGSAGGPPALSPPRPGAGA